jgi:hypothetical protein
MHVGKLVVCSLWGCGLPWYDSERGPVADFCEDDNQLRFISRVIKDDCFMELMITVVIRERLYVFFLMKV